MASNVGIIGLGKLGFAVALAIENKGHKVSGYDINPNVAQYIKNREIPYREEGLQELLDKTEITLAPDIKTLVGDNEIIFVAIQTPHEESYEGSTRIPPGRKDFDYSYLVAGLKSVFEACEQWGDRKTVVVISTCLPGTYRREIKPHLNEFVNYVYNPFFIAMGTVRHDFENPEFVLIGSELGEINGLQELYSTIHDKRLLVTDITTAEAIKVSYNTFITTKTVLANLWGEIAHKTGANVDDIYTAWTLATDRLISPKYLKAGMGDGGGCFPAGELVMTVDGMRSIETINPGDLVLTSNGTMQKVVHRWERDYEGDLVSVTVRGLPKVKMTAEHPVLVKKDGRSRVPDGRRNTYYKIIDKLSDVKELRADSLSLDELIAWPHVNYKEQGTFSQDFLRLGGWYLAEGSAELNVRRGRVRFDLHAREEDDAKDIESWLLSCAIPSHNNRGTNARVTHKVEGNCRSVRFGNIGLVSKLVSTFGKGSRDKFIPSDILWASEDTIKTVLWGLIRGDGHRGKSGISYSTVSPHLAWGVWIMLHRLNLNPTLRKIPARGNHQEAYEIRVRNRRLASELCEIVGWEKYDYDKDIQTYADDGSLVWRHIQKLEKEGFTGKVYNLWVEGNHTYIVGCGAVHNCHPRDNIALSWLANELDLSYNYFDALMKAREEHTDWQASTIEEAHNRTGNPVRILGKSFKPETDITTGSPSRLLVNLLRERLVESTSYDPYIDADIAEDDQPKVYFIATAYEYFKDYPYAKGSIIIDPFGLIGDIADCAVIRLGRG